MFLFSPLAEGRKKLLQTGKYPKRDIVSANAPRFVCIQWIVFEFSGIGIGSVVIVVVVEV